VGDLFATTGGPPVSYLPGWLPEPAAALVYLRHRMPWVHREFKDGVLMPRLEALLGPEGASYSYSGIEYRCSPMVRHPVQRLADRVNAALGTEFNACFVNLYRDGSDSIGWHADDEPSLGPIADVEIASLSLGVRRRFLMRRRVGERQFERAEWALGHGDLLHMRAGCQDGWEHAAPKEPEVVGERIALTFRRLL